MISGKSPAGHSRNLYEATFDRATLIINSDNFSSYLIVFHLISSLLISSHLISSYFIWSHLFSSHLILSHRISSYFIVSHLFSSYHLILSHLISSYIILSHLISFIYLSIYLCMCYLYMHMHLISGPLALLPSPAKTHVNHTSLPTRRDQVGDEYHGVHIWSAVLMGTWQ